jgi:hypothetical protein
MPRELKTTNHNIKCREIAFKNYHQDGGKIKKNIRYIMKKYNLTENFFTENETDEEKFRKIKMYDQEQKMKKINEKLKT